MLAAGLRYRDTARGWLDRRFFREQYDARQVLLSLAGRIPFETDPNELTALVLPRLRCARPRLCHIRRTRDHHQSILGADEQRGVC